MVVVDWWWLILMCSHGGFLFNFGAGDQHYRLNALKHLNSVVLEGYKPFTSHLFNESVSNDDDSKTLTGLASAIEHRRDLPTTTTTTTTTGAGAGGFNFSSNTASSTNQQGGFHFAAAVASSSSSSGAFRTEQKPRLPRMFGSAAATSSFGSAAATASFGSAATSFGSARGSTSSFGSAAAPSSFGSARGSTSSFGSAAPSVGRSRSGRATRRRVIRRPVGGGGSFR